MFLQVNLETDALRHSVEGSPESQEEVTVGDCRKNPDNWDLEILQAKLI